MKVRDWRDEIHEFGDNTGKPVAVHFRDARIERALLLDPQLAIAEGYMDGEIEFEAGSTIYDFLSLVTRNIGNGDLPGWMRLADGFRPGNALLRQMNNPRQARRNASHHYDLPGSLYDLFLDKDKQYSCAYFATGAETLDEAQLCEKKAYRQEAMPFARPERAGHRLRLGRAVPVFGARGGREGLRDYLERGAGAACQGAGRGRGRTGAAFRLCDYRAVNEAFDRIVSVGMFEHVGIPNYSTFFRKVNDCLKDGGVALLHTIGRLSGPGSTNPFITKYIFPGGYAPALSEIVPAIEKSGLMVTDIEVLRLHYAETLAVWRRNFEAAWDKASGLWSERFCRMWQFYLAGGEVSFRYQNMAVFQIQLAKRVDAVPLTRDYLYVHERGEERAGAAPV